MRTLLVIWTFAFAIACAKTPPAPPPADPAAAPKPAEPAPAAHAPVVHHTQLALSPEARAAVQKGALPTATPLERGTYLTAAVVDCVHCHTHRDTNDYTKAFGPDYAGGEVFGAEWKMPGTIITPNLTPDMATGLGAWSDDEIKRAIREGINKKGERIFPLMPSHYFQAMSDEDLAGIVAFLRALPPSPKASHEDTKLALDRATLPKLPPITAPVPSVGTDPVKRGEYLVRMANCRTCHSPTKGGQEIGERFLAGGVYFTAPFGSFPTPNITPDKETGIGAWTDDEIRAVLTQGKRKSGMAIKSNLMPWWLYRNLTDDDVNAIIAYLRSLKPVKNDINLLENHFPLGG